jgi:hypothetical protein
MRSSAIHESSHCLAVLLGRVPVVKLFIDGTGGGCLGASICPDPADDIIASLAGGVGASLLSADGVGHISGMDATLAESAGVVWATRTGEYWDNRAKRRFVALAENLVIRHESAIRWLASELESAQWLDESAMSALCRRPGSPLAFASYLYAGLSPSRLS